MIKGGGVMRQVIATATQLSHALRSERKARGLSQAEAGQLVGLLPKTISALENRPGSASIESLLKLLSALGLELAIDRKMPKEAPGKGSEAAAEEW
jgi:HTH-type transcriptional regulator/antitoxin HipB